MSNEILDLDALLPQPRVIKLGGEEIKVEPPTTASVITLGFLGQKIQEGQKLEADQIEKLVADLQTAIEACIPQLKGKTLTSSQLLAVVQIVTDMGMPKDATELSKRGITPTDPKEPQS